MSKDRTQPKYRYVWMGDDGDWYGTDDESIALEIDSSVCDCLKGEDFDTGELVTEYMREDLEEEDEEDEE